MSQRDVYANVTHGDTDRKWGALRLGDPVTSERDYEKRTPPIFAMDFRVLASREEMLSAARNVAASIARSPRKRIVLATIDLPADVADLCGAHSARDFFTVPVVDELESIARKMNTSPDELIRGFVPHETREFLRLGGVEFLSHFKSDDSLRATAAYTLGECGPTAKAAVPALKVALEDADAEVQRAASYAIDVIMERKQDSKKTPTEH